MPSPFLTYFPGLDKGVLSRNFYDDYFVLAINSVENISFQEERCDPDFLQCGENTSAGNEVIIEEIFSAVTSQTKLENEAWSNINLNGGEARFETGTFDGDRYIRISAFNSEEKLLEVWLVSPPIDLSNYISIVLSFDIMASYDNTTILDVFISEDFTGNLKTAIWLPLSANIPVGSTNHYGLRYEPSAIDISCFENKIHVGFRYLGSAPDKITTYDIDNIRITGTR